LDSNIPPLPASIQTRRGLPRGADAAGRVVAHWRAAGGCGIPRRDEVHRWSVSLTGS